MLSYHKFTSIKILISLSCIAYMVISASSVRALVGNLIFAGLFIILFCLFFSQNKMHWKDFLKKKYILISLCISILDSIGFYSKLNSPHVYELSHAMGVSSQAIMMVICFIGTLVPLPFISFVLVLLFENQFKDEEKYDKFFSSEKFYRICIIVASIGIALQFICSFNMSIRMDSAFTLNLIKSNYKQVIELTSKDFHPPLYYIIVKFLADIVKNFTNSIGATIYIAKLVSVIPFVFIFLICVKRIKSEWSGYVAGMCAICLVGIPNLSFFSIEIRMYSFAMLFVFMSYLAFCDILLEKKVKSWLLLMLFGIAAAYTHYYAAIAVAMMYFFLLIYCIKYNKTSIKYFISAAVGTICLYSPWLTVLWSQVRHAEEDYWIPPIRLPNIVQYFKFMFGGILLLFICVVCLYMLYKEIKNKFVTVERGYAVFAAAAIPVWVIAFGMIFSILIRPVFIVRYMMPGLVCFWLGMAAAVDLMNNTAKKVVYTAFISLLCVAGVFCFVGMQIYDSHQANRACMFFDSHKGAVYIADDLGVGTTMREMSGEDVIIYYRQSINQEQVIENIQAGSEVYFGEIKFNNIPEEILSIPGIKYECVGQFEIESPINMYKLSLE